MTLLRPHRSADVLIGEAELVEIDGGYAVTIPLSEGSARVVLQPSGGSVLEGAGLRTDGDVGAATFDVRGKVRETFVAGGTLVEAP